tara:strand:+ start:400 stop:921 length:522 start_codon:yes stop_codon:yes gene_type:complete
MKKITTIIYLSFFILTANYSNSESNPPFKNMSISKLPIDYKEILFKDYDGNTINLEDQKGKIYMLNFWATWCLPCKKEMPYLDNLQNVNGIKIFPINIEKNNKFKTEIFFKNLEIKNLSIYFDIENNLVNLFRLRGIPTTIILNKDRKEIARVLGAVDFSDQKFIKWISSYTN